MKLPWDEKYIKISFHAIVTFAAIYLLYKLLDALMFAFTNLNIMFDGIGSSVTRLFSVLSPLLTALLISYLLDPIIDFFQEKYEQFYLNKLRPKIINSKISKRIQKNKYAAIIVKRRKAGKSRSKKLKPDKQFKRRNAGVAITLSTILLALGFLGSFIFRVGKNSSVSAEYVQIITKTINDFNDLIFRAQTILADLGLLEYLSKYIENFISQITDLLGGLSNSAINVIASAGNGLLTFVLALVVSIYFMRDKERYFHQINDVMDVLIPGRINKPIKNFFGDINAIFSEYIRGQLIDAAIMALLIGAFLSIINVKFAMLIGIFSGFANLIPYFGAIIAFALAVLTALLSGDPLQALYAAIGIIILQQIDGMIIVPRVVGAKVELSPVLVILSLSIAGSLFGIVGMLLAVPLCAIIKLFLVRFLKRQRLRKEQNIDVESVQD